MRHPLAKLLIAPALGLGLLAAAPAMADGVTIKLSDDHLVDGDGMSLYLFEPDEQGMSTCYDACAKAWPPLSGDAKAEGMAKASMLGTVKREDGTMQVTYNDWPLYYFIQDKKPGDIKGQDKEGFGGEWYLVGADGKAAE